MIGEAAFDRIEPFAALMLALARWAVTSVALDACSPSCGRKAATGPRTDSRAAGRAGHRRAGYARSAEFGKPRSVRIKVLG
jgi:uncharacterized protein YbbK (DUF523 family)